MASAMIEDFARRNGIEARVQRVVVTSQVVTFCLRLHNEAQLDKVRALDGPLGLLFRAKNVRVDRYRGIVAVEVSSDDFEPLPLAHLTPGAGPIVAVGHNVLRQQVDINLADDTTAHALIAGATGMGKTVLMQSILLQLARQNPPDRLHVLGIDGKIRGLLPFRDLAHLVHPIIMEPDEAVQALAWAVEEMERRKRAFGEKPPHLLVVIDEIAGIINRTGGANGKVAGALAYLSQEGRELGIHLLLATQHPLQDVLGGSLARANLTARFMLKVTDASASRLVSGMADAGGEKLMGNGDCVLVTPGDKQRFQVALPAEADFDRLPRGSTGRIDLSRYANANGDIASPPAERADPLTPQQIGWVLANGIPGINAIARQFGIGNAKAVRLKEYCRGIAAELEANKCAVCQAEESENDDDG